MTTRQQREEWAQIAGGKTLGFPDLIKFDEIFAEEYPDKESAPETLVLDGNYHTGTSPWCRISTRDGDGGRDTVSRYLRPRDEILQYVKANNLGGWRSYFEVIDRGDNVSLVTFHWDQIIGGRWVAFIDTDSIPEAQS